MTIYFANRAFRVLGMASTDLMGGLSIADDLKTEGVETGTVTFECEIPYDADTRDAAREYCAVGNYILLSGDGQAEWYTIIENEDDTYAQTMYIYAEDAGMDLLNTIALPFAAEEAHPIAWYVEKWINDTGFEILLNEIPSLTRKLDWDGEATVAERLASVATQFDNAEISYSFEVKGLVITHKYVNIHKSRGKDTGIQLRLNREVDRIVTRSSVANLCTALYVTGGTPESEDDDDETEQEPITLDGYDYDDGDMYTYGVYLCSREALKVWSRYLYAGEPEVLVGYGGHLIGTYSYDTTSQSELCNRAVSELKERCVPEVNYEINIPNLDADICVGDTINIIDDNGELYLSARVLELMTSICNNTRTATLGDYLLQDSGIGGKIDKLSTQITNIQTAVNNVIIDVSKAVTVTMVSTLIEENNKGITLSYEKYVAQSLEDYTTTEDVKSMIQLSEEGIRATVDLLETDGNGNITSISGMWSLTVDKTASYLTAQADYVSFTANHCITIASENLTLDADGTLSCTNATLAGMLTLSGTSEYIRGDSDLWLAPGGNTPNSEGVTAAYDWWRNSYEEGHEDNVVTSGDLIIGGTSTARELVVLGYPTISDATNKTNVVGLGVAVNEYNYGLYDYTNNRWMLRSEYGTDEVKVDIAFRVNSAVYAGSVETDGGLTVGGTLKMPNSANTSTSYPLLEIADSGTVGYLTADIGSSDTPVYINGGKLVASKYDLSTLAKASDIPDLSGYVTWGGLGDELAGYATQSWVQQQGYTTQSWVQSQGYLTSSSIDLSDYAKTSDLKKYLPLTGGTVTGKITSTGGGFYSTASDQTEAFYHKHPDTNYEVQIGVGGGGYNRGVYIPSTGEWLICRHTYANSSSSTGYSYYNVISGKLYYRDGNSASGDDGTIDEGSIHSSAIGSYKYTYVTGTSLSSGTYTAVRSVSLDAGVWIIRGNVYFPTSSASGYAAVNISGTSGSSTYNNDTCSFVYMTGTHFANLHVTRFVDISSSTTYYLNAGQGTGSSKSVNAYMQALRIL